VKPPTGGPDAGNRQSGSEEGSEVLWLVPISEADFPRNPEKNPAQFPIGRARNESLNTANAAHESTRKPRRRFTD
jgi:hypothetical protein